MTRLFKLTAFAVALTALAVSTHNADAGSCRRSRPPRCTSPSPARPHTGGPRAGAPGATAPGAGAPGVPGAGQAGQPGTAGQPGQRGQTGQAGQDGQGGQQAGAAGARAEEAQAVSVPAGATITLPGNRGAQTGQVNLILNGVRLPLTIVNWSENGVTITLPQMQLSSATSAELEIVLPGSDAETIAIQLQPQAAVLIVQ